MTHKSALLAGIVLSAAMAGLAACGGGSHTGAATTSTTTSTSATISTLAVDPYTSRALRRIFARGGPFARDAMYECLADALAQHIPYQQALKLCETKLLESGLQGFGEQPFDPLETIPSARGTRRPFDASTITAACGSGNPNVGQPAGGGSSHYVDKDGRDWGVYTWGSGPGYNGLTPKESEDAKAAAATDAVRLEKLYEAARIVQEKANATVNTVAPGAVQQQLVNLAASAANAASTAADQAVAKAKADPNKAPSPPAPTPSTTPAPSTAPAPTTPPASTPPPTPGSTSGTGRATGSSECEEALQRARELLYECNRTGWKAPECEKLQARMNGCPDPARILVDPEQGYTCGATVDPMAAAVAARERCQQLERGVEGTDPCALPRIDESVRALAKVRWDLCSDPRVHIDPESGACAGTLELPDFGTPDIDKIIVFGLNKLGGPVFVLPKDPQPTGWTPYPKPTTAPPPPLETPP
jgi:hypothetical protein